MPHATAALPRREVLCRIGGGFGALGLASVFADAGLLCAALPKDRTVNPLSPRAPHFPPRAKRIIFLFMNGGPSHVDTFDPKPSLAKYSGQKPTGNLFRKAQAGFAPSPFHFQPHGHSGVVLSELFPRLSE